MNITGVSESQIHREILSDFLNLSEFDVFSKHVCAINESIVTEDPVQTFMLINKGSLYNRLLKPLIVDAVIGAEKTAAGSGEICLNLILSLVPHCIRDTRQNESHKSICDELSLCEKRLIKDIVAVGQKLDKDSLYTILDQEISGEESKRLASSAIEMSSLTTSIFVERSNAVGTKIEKASGCQFNISVINSFLMGRDSWNRKKVKCIIIDGMVETVGEIHHLLEEASISKEPYVIFAREFKPEILSTIYTNLQRGTIDVLPISVGLDEDTINILNDIAIACNTDVISSYKGDLISSAVKADLSVIDKISISKNSAIIENNKRSPRIDSQLSYLKRKRSLQRTGEMRSLFDKRIKSLLSDRVTVSIGTDIRAKERTCVEEVDKFFRMIRSLISYGYFKTSTIKKSKFKYDTMAKDIIEKRGGLLPTACACIAIKYAISTISSISSTGYAIIDDI